MTRRSLFSSLFGGAVAALNPQAFVSIAKAATKPKRSNSLVHVQAYSRECLKLLNRNLSLAKAINLRDQEFIDVYNWPKIGQTINVRVPIRLTDRSQVS